MTAIRIRCAHRDATAVAEALTARGWGTQWIEEPLLQSTDEEGYVLHALPPETQVTVHAWPTREGATPAVPDLIHGYPIEIDESTGATDETVDWEARWRASHPSRIPIAPGWVLCPPWGIPNRDERALVIEPGAAFGTGLHPTTRHCLAVLYKLLSEHADLRVLDLGSGSGVLAIASVLWGARSVRAVDIDEDAKSQLEINLGRNGLSTERVEFCVGDLLDSHCWQSPERWNVVLCNVGAKDVEKALEGVALSAMDAFWVGSGIFLQSWERVAKTAENKGLRVLEKHVEEDWVTVLWVRGS